MKKNLTEIVFILDRSGSMAGLVEETIGGINAMIEQQKAEDGQAYVSTVLFSTSSEVLHDRVDVQKVPPMTRRDYLPGGCTALLDAVGDALHPVGNVHKYAREEDRPEHTIFVITTDGRENASHRYTAQQVKQKIERQKEKYGWEFIFLGANIDALDVAEHIGIHADRAANFMADRAGTEATFASVNEAVCQVRSCAPMRADWKDAVDADFASRFGD